MPTGGATAAMTKRKTTSEPPADELAPAAAEVSAPVHADELAPGPAQASAPPPADHALHHPGDVADEAHGPDDHGDTDGHDDHAHGGDALGPIDVQAWGALALGVGAGLLVVVGLLISTRLLAPAAL
jgi:hypothetical protein